MIKLIEKSDYSKCNFTEMIENYLKPCYNHLKETLFLSKQHGFFTISFIGEGSDFKRKNMFIKGKMHRIAG